MRIRVRSTPALPENIQCLSCSFCTTRSTVLRVPKGLAQAMQWNGSSSFTTRRIVPGGEVEPWLERDHVFRAGGGAQAALDAQRFRESQHRRVRVVAQRMGRTGGD